MGSRLQTVCPPRYLQLLMLFPTTGLKPSFVVFVVLLFVYYVVSVSVVVVFLFLFLFLFYPTLVVVGFWAIMYVTFTTILVGFETLLYINFRFFLTLLSEKLVLFIIKKKKSPLDHCKRCNYDILLAYKISKSNQIDTI